MLLKTDNIYSATATATKMMQSPLLSAGTSSSSGVSQGAHLRFAEYLEQMGAQEETLKNEALKTQLEVKQKVAQAAETTLLLGRAAKEHRAAAKAASPPTK